MHRDITRKLDEQREQLIFVKRSDFTTINSRQRTEFRSVYLQFRYSITTSIIHFQTATLKGAN